MNSIVQWKQYPALVRQADVVGKVRPIGECERAAAVVIAGHGQTDATGRWEMDLPGIICDGKNMPLNGRPSFVATPTEPIEPHDVVVSAAIDGAIIRVRSWNIGGGPAKDIIFSWHIVVLSAGD